MTATKAKALRELLTSDRLRFLMEAHNGMSAKVAEEAGFEGLWGSGLSISASMGVRDNNEMSWTQVLDLLEFMSDAVAIPLLLDGDTGYGNFNNMRRLVQKLETRHIAGVCIEDKLFPKTNSFIGENQPLADLDEFCGKIKAGKDAQRDDDFNIVARVEALIAGWGLGEALKRAEAYRRAGADAILIHSKQSRPDEILAFMDEWARALPGGHRADHLLRHAHRCVPRRGGEHRHLGQPPDAQRPDGHAADGEQLREEESLLNVEDRLVTVKEVFRLQGASELEEAEKRYLPPKVETPAGDRPRRRPGQGAGGPDRGPAQGDDRDRRQATAGANGRHAAQHRHQGHHRRAWLPQGGGAASRARRTSTTTSTRRRRKRSRSSRASRACRARCWSRTATCSSRSSFPMHLFESDSDFCIAVEPRDQIDTTENGYRDLVTSDRAFHWSDIDEHTQLVQMSTAIPEERIHGEWIGLLKMTGEGVVKLRELGESVSDSQLRTMRMADVFDLLIANGEGVEVVYVRGHWLDVDDLHDVVAASNFDGSGQYR